LKHVQTFPKTNEPSNESLEETMTHLIESLVENQKPYKSTAAETNGYNEPLYRLTDYLYSSLEGI
ncbi:hypothetical protein HAX54_026839, partial [Datura stramonium]|nr:hypothetical protein [Datura stramonium]